MKRDRQLPAGQADSLQVLYAHVRADVSDCIAAPVGNFGLTIWEPLRTKAPGPHLTMVWCCYSNTVIFYRTPFLEHCPPWKDGQGHWIRPSTPSFVEWDQLEPRFARGDLVASGGRQFYLQGYSVRWATAPAQAAGRPRGRRRWWACHRADTRRPLQ